MGFSRRRYCECDGHSRSPAGPKPGVLLIHPLLDSFPADADRSVNRASVFARQETPEGSTTAGLPARQA